ncbi:MAG: hypothetical protein R2789_13495 [Microthrixaceae bacterium]
MTASPPCLTSTLPEPRRVATGWSSSANAPSSGNDARSYLGYVDVAPGTGLTANLVHTGADALVGSNVTATATRIDGGADNGVRVHQRAE